MFFIYPYKIGSVSVKVLKKALGAKEIKLENSRFRHRDRDVVINWGSSSCPYASVNTADAVRASSNKLHAFRILSEGGGVPDWTENRLEAATWLTEGFDVVCRTKLNGHSGEGIVIAELEEALEGPIVEEALVFAPLYVKYIPKKEEYRVHVFGNEAFFTQRKARKREIEEVNWKVRNYRNGFIYAHKDVELPQEAEDMAIKAVNLLGLDFGAVDLIYNEKSNRYYVLEVNTAPGLVGTTLERYVEMFKKL